ncbi:MAG TPA: hypothetical protein VFV99_27855 [Kofleriaceae bacterium]|nr:hypothetical protein [Kofleriaceae bacterium]
MLGLVVRSHEARADFAQCSAPLSACTVTSSGCCTASFNMTSGTHHPLIIAMDRCHQPIGSGTSGPPGVSPPRKEWSISSISRTGSTVTVVTTANHGAGNGDYVKIVGTGNSALNGTFVVTNGCSNCTTLTYSTTSSGNISAITTGKALTFNMGNGWCGDAPGSATRIGGNAADDGMFKTYGLVYRLMQRAIPVYWLVNPGKAIVALNSGQNAGGQTYLANDVDLWVLTGDLTDPPTSADPLIACGSGCTQPVHRLTSATLVPKTDSYQYKQFPVRGGTFLIAAEDRANFDDFWLRQGAYSSLDATKYNWSNSGIDLYELDPSAKLVYQDYTSGDGTSSNRFTTVNGAPLAVKIDYEPPRIACVGCNNNVAQGWLGTAGIQDPASPASCASGEFSPSDATYCVLNDTDVAQGTLVSGGFGWLWLFGYNDNSPCGNSAEKAVFDKVRDFMTSLPAIRNAGHGVFLDDSIKVAEGCPNKQLLGKPSSGDGLDIQNNGNTEPFIMRYPSNLFMQSGDLVPASANGTVQGWKYYKNGSPNVGYQTPFQVSTSSLRRLMTADTTGTNNTACVLHESTTDCDSFTPSAATGDLLDVATYARFKDQLNNGLAYYLAGNQLNNSGSYAELRMLLNSLLALPDETFTSSPTIVEVSRSGPIVATDEDSTVTVFQGTYEHFDPIPNIPKATTSAGLARFTFPYALGHLRQIPVASYAACSAAGCDTGNGSRTAISSLSGVVFDAADHIPTVNTAGCATNFNGSCRTVFTTLQSGRLPPHVMFTTANYNATTASAPTDLGNTLASNFTTAEKQTFISRILAGRKDASNNWIPKLGGIDRSTVAVIEPSTIAGSAGRPTMAYVGATDGMMHAFCVTTGGGCDEVGRELWAYIPRTVLPDLRQSTAHIDGSPNVIDAYGDFDNNGSNAWHTILIFHTGTGRMTANNVVPAVYAIDVTAPNNPRVLWEYTVTAVGSRSTYELGVGLNLTAGTVTISGVKKTVAYVQTQNGGTGGAASVLTAIDVETGAKIWQKGDLYPSPRAGTHEGAPSAGIPGGAVGLDTTGTGRINKVVYGTLYGDVFVRDAATGANQNGTVSGVDTPLMRLATDYHPIGAPPAILAKNGTQYAAFATGGYADSQLTLWRGENESPVPTQMVFAVTTSYSGTSSLTDAETDLTKLPIKFSLGAGEAGFSQLTVVGNQLFVTTDTTNINDYAFGTSSTPTGHAYNYDFGAATPSLGTTLIIASGAASLFNNGTTMITGSGRYGEKLTTDALGTSGAAVDPMATSNQLRRALWLRTE